MPNLYKNHCVTRCEPAENCYVYFIIRNHVACHVTNDLKNNTRAIFRIGEAKRIIFVPLLSKIVSLRF